MGSEHVRAPELAPAEGGELHPEGELHEAELRQRVVFSLLLPAIATAAHFGIPLKEIGSWIQVAYFEHLRQSGLTLKEASDILDVSVRTAKRLSQQLKVNFLRPEAEHNLLVRIEFMLRAEAMSLARLNQVLREVPEEKVKAAVELLVAERRIELQNGRTPTYAVVKSVNSLVRDTWLARIGGLNSLLENLTDVTYGRFFAKDARSFARTLSFHVRPERFSELEAAFAHLVSTVAELDADAEGHKDAVPVRLSHFFGPFHLLEQEQEQESAAPKGHNGVDKKMKGAS